MDIVKPTILPGFMELTPKEQIAFNRMYDIIRQTYEDFGYLPIDTPVIEKTEVLLAKGGGETEKQIYRFQKGDTDMSLRFDLTVPLARYSAQHFSELEFPFKRYQIAKVYRGERNQRGRFREFYQADADVIGNGKLSILNDAEMPAIIYTIFKRFDFGDFTIRINNRKLLRGFYEAIGIKNTGEVLRVIDKLDKIGLDQVKESLSEIGVSVEQMNKIIDFIQMNGTSGEILNRLDEMSVEGELYREGLSELRKVLSLLPAFGVPERYFKLDLTLTRGLDYYTGTIYETYLNDYPSLGSVCGGGRYDNLAGYYTTQVMPGVGISIGLTRLFYQLNEAGLIQKEENSLIPVMILPMEGFEAEAIEVSKALRTVSIANCIHYEDGKLGKRFAYADKLGIPYVLILGEEEAKSEIYTLKDLRSGEQYRMKVSEIINKLGEMI